MAARRPPDHEQAGVGASLLQVDSGETPPDRLADFHGMNLVIGGRVHDHARHLLCVDPATSRPEP